MIDISGSLKKRLAEFMTHLLNNIELKQLY